MRPRWVVGPLALATFAIGAATLRGSRVHPSHSVRPDPARIREQDIAFYQQRIEADPTGAIDLAVLGGLYLDRFRQSGDDGDLVKAETAARRSLGNREVRNAGALQLLASALLGQHRFLEAKAVALRLVALDEQDAVAEEILGEILVELGEYPAADRIFSRLTPQRYNLALTPRYARWLELRGHAAEARRLLEWARAETERRDPAGTASERLAWYDLRLGEMALRFKGYSEARRRLDGGLRLLPNNWRLLAARARLALATGDYHTAIALGDSSLGLHLDPATLAEVGDAWRARHDTTHAAEYYRAMEAATQAPRGGFHRVWYLALLDHNLRVPGILAAVTNDLETRRDVYGYDLLAWALYKRGRVAEAKAAIAKALAWGTEDPLLHTHARAIGFER